MTGEFGTGRDLNSALHPKRRGRLSKSRPKTCISLRLPFPSILLKHPTVGCEPRRTARQTGRTGWMGRNVPFSLERTPLQLNRDALSILAGAHVLLGRPVSTFPGRALAPRS